MITVEAWKYIDISTTNIQIEIKAIYLGIIYQEDVYNNEATEFSHLLGNFYYP